VILARNGLVICSSMPMRINEKAIAAISAAMVESGKIASEELFAGKLRRVTIESEDGMLISIEFKEGIIFAAFVKERANVGLVLSQMKKTARDILKVIG
ncbi:MAG: roadblock/LC7 domain-containing protein, partial [Candidatus Aenigmarchaeota archaeon]|nr:roadblock/LC7 domain-containing protein [Candidatus Aenigmarchaeota archaeon]